MPWQYTERLTGVSNSDALYCYPDREMRGEC